MGKLKGSRETEENAMLEAAWAQLKEELRHLNLGGQRSQDQFLETKT